MSHSHYNFILFLIIICTHVSRLDAHGRFMKPPNRSSVWRFQEFASYNPPKNYNDNELFCGSIHQKDNPGEECGVCGDPVSQATPRDNEIGGTFYKGIITGRYTSGQVIDVEVELTRSHKGFMEWRLCTNPKSAETQDCFNKNLLQLADGSGSKLIVNDSSGWYKTQLRLPQGVTCDHCSIQWNYRAGC
ncbi:hypothetical protein Fcan01_03308 [Folsomia candida]|uniref:Chitin-binding type-4 domain-containing protein n=1 Tax=Folsomia candida TaxID=158441 RepID=A0A226F690_FOLCA|nr:hypothetical protein Fcan01_03308 [Folsomia candida]